MHLSNRVQTRIRIGCENR